MFMCTKARFDKRCVEEEVMNQGSVIVYYGEGKGKSSSAIGHAILEAAVGESVTVIQFLKGNNQEEISFLNRLEPEVRLFAFEKSDENFSELSEEQKQEAMINIKNGIGFAKEGFGDRREYDSCTG